MSGSLDNGSFETVGALARELSSRGHEISPDGLLEILDGVNATPLENDDESWLEMLGSPSDTGLRRGLLALRAHRASRTPTSSPAETERLSRLRRALRTEGLDGLVLPRADEHQGEFLPHRAERVAWLSGFTGSAAVVAVLQDRAAILTDGRYTIQVAQQVDTSAWEVRHITREPLADWIGEHVRQGHRIGYDPWLHSIRSARGLVAAVERAGGTPVALEANPIDQLWEHRPAAPLSPAVPHPDQHAGQSSASKREAIANILVADDHDATVLTSPESIAWLLNIRGRDVPSTPLCLSFAILDRAGTVELFVDRRKITDATRAHLGNAVSIHPPSGLAAALAHRASRGARLRLDPASSPVWIANHVTASGGTVVTGPDPVVLPRARKNPIEIEGARAAHRRDGTAFVRFLCWFAGEAPSGRLDEQGAADRLRAFRAEQELFTDLSFDTISAAGPNGAIVHYRVTAQTNRTIRPGDLYLVDSGAQYRDGTTDITRTIAVGDPGAQARDRFTRVLKAHIALATMRFPEGTTGDRLDAVARAPLWQAGLDFDHGTGHGVGSYLGVHEGPQSISGRSGAVALEPGMIVSNEPGYYREGAYGIRLENLLVVREERPDGGERNMLGFETITLAPFDRSMITTDLLAAHEIDWINLYHARVRDTLSPDLEPGVGRWLDAATRPLD